jgi:hypothetical protein
MLDVFVRVASFESGVTNFNRRLFDAYAAEVARVDGNADGVIDAIEGDLEDESDDQPNERLYIPATKYNRFAVTREINDGLLAPRFRRVSAPGSSPVSSIGSLQPSTHQFRGTPTIASAL